MRLISFLHVLAGLPCRWRRRQPLRGRSGSPVNLTTGRKLIPGEIDFSLPGLMPIEGARFYASDLTVDSVLGRGWVLPWEQSLRRKGR